MPSPLTRLRDSEFYSPPPEPPADRFIPTRALVDLDLARNSLLDARPRLQLQEHPSAATTTSLGTGREYYRRWVEENLRAAGADGNLLRMLPFRSPRGGDACRRSLRLVEDMLQEAKDLDSVPARWCSIPKYPQKVLDAPGMADDFYLNLMDWGKENMLAMALDSDVYLKKEHGESVLKLPRCDIWSPRPTSVAWSCDGKKLAVGCEDSQIEIRTFQGHTDRVGSLSWNGNILTSGSRDKYIINYDVRAGTGVYYLKGHASEVCGLRWSPDGTRLASGANDNVVSVWHSLNMGPTRSLHRLAEQTAAVRALAWIPFTSSRLASGGGSTDQCIKIWNTENGACIKTVKTGSQVCGLEWNRHENEIVSAHGYCNNELSVWSYPSMQKVADMNYHRKRVLELSQGPDGSTVASASADETLCIWKLCPSKKVTDDDDSVLSLKRLQIR